MRFGVREICDVVFKPLTSVDIGNQHFDAGQPVLYLDTAKTSTLEGASTTVYAQGGKGNPRLIGWDGEKTLTFTVEDALMSPTSFSMLSGAGVIKGSGDLADKDARKIYVHTYYDLTVEKEGEKFVAKLTDVERNGATLVVTREAPIYPILLDSAGAQDGYLPAIKQADVSVEGADEDIIGPTGEIKAEGKTIVFNLSEQTTGQLQVGKGVRVDCYTVYTEGAYEMQIDANTFAGYYYIEASTLFRDEATGVDMAAEFIIPRGKIQSNFTFTMANSGDPSTFTFTIDAFPAYTKFNKSKKVMAVLQIVDAEGEGHNYARTDVDGHKDRTSDEDVNDWYEKSIFDNEDDAGFNPGPGSEPEEPEEPEVTVSITAQIPSQDELKDYASSVGFSGSIAQEGDTFKVTGTFTNKSGEDTLLDFPPGENTGYYLPIKFEGEDGTVLQRVGKSKQNVIGSTGDGQGKAIIILYVEKSNPVINMTANDQPFTIDCSSCSFNE